MYHLKLVYKPGKELLIADTLSRAYLPNDPAPEKSTCDVFSVRKEEYLIKSVEEIDMVEFLPITAERLADLREKTEHDKSLKFGWPDKKEEVPPEIRNYVHFKEELTIEDGVLFKGNRVIVKTAHGEKISFVILVYILDGCLRKARDVLF